MATSREALITTVPATSPVAVTPLASASQAALDVIAAGGNAVDGAIAANAMLGVALPDTCGPGGDLFALVHREGEAEPLALNASGRAGSGQAAAALRDAGVDEVPLRSPWSITVPGCVDGWELLSDRLGAISLGRALAPAIEAAEGGFEVTVELARSLARIRSLIGHQPSAEPLYPDGSPPDPGTVLRRPRLAETLREVGDAGRTAFYDGRVGEAIVEATGGLISRDDLERRQAEWIDPLGAPILGATAWTIPPNSQGYLTLAALMLFEALDPPDDATDPEYHHLLVEAYRAVAWERDDLVSDPATAPLPPDELVSRERILSRCRLITRDGIAAWPEPAPAPGGTAYLCVRDGAGLAVSLIQSNFHGIGSGLSAGDTGVFLHNRGAGFTLRPGHPNEMLPGRRPLHTLSPTLWTQAGGSLLLGTRGGQYQPQILIQLAAALRHAGRPPAEAQSTPRWLVDGWGAGESPRLRIEDRAGDDLVSGLTERGHEVMSVDPWQEGWGPVSIIATEAGTTMGAADPRVSSAAALAG